MSRFAVFLLCLCALGACRDAGADAYARARQQHQSLLLAGEKPGSKRYQELEATLASVPKSSARYADAQRLLGALSAVRKPVRAPLAVVPRSTEHGETPAVLAARAECERLAQAMGREGGATPETMAALDRCRVRVEKLDVAAVHNAQGGPAVHGDHGHVDVPPSDANANANAHADAGAAR